MAQLQLFLLGAPRLEQDGRVLALDTRKALALLAYLTLTDQAHSRDTLATLFWPDYEQSQARANLRRTLSTLTKAVGKESLEIDRENIGLTSDNMLWVDACQFQKAFTTCRSHDHTPDEICPTCLTLLTEVVALYRADFMAGFSLPDSPNFEEWQFFQSEELRRQAINMLEMLVRGHSSRGEFEPALQAARRWVVLDSLDEMVHGYLMQLYTQTGQRNSALRQYQTLCRILDEELGLPPSEEITTLYQAIQENRLSMPQMKLAAPDVQSQPVDENASVLLSKPLHLTLPVPTTPFVGRKTELETLSEMLADAACHLLTLTGPGGVGKTRLAIEVATGLRDSFADGVCFVSMAPVSSNELIVSTIAGALGLAFHGPGQLSQHLFNYLSTKQVLLILDDCEHLLTGNRVEQSGLNMATDCTTLLADLLQAAPQVKLLVTSRERLHLYGEWVFQIHGFPVPSVEQIDRFESYSVVNLFIQMARRVNSDFKLLPTERSAVVRICQIVDGIPLGIELAAAWTHLLSCTEIAAEIERNLDFLTTTARDVPVRQRSLRAVFDHSWKLLPDEEQQVLSRLSVFRGGFGREAAQEIAGATLAILSALVDKSLLYRVEGGRYALHELVRQFAVNYLSAYPQEPDATFDHHCAYYAALFQQNQSRLRSQQQAAVLESLALEIGNLRQAWDWAIAHQKVAEINRATEGVAIFYDLSGRTQEGASALDRAATVLDNVVTTAPTPDSQFALGRVLAFRGWFAMRQGQLERSDTLLQQSLNWLQPAGPSQTLAETLLIAGLVARQRGRFDQANEGFSNSLAMSRAVGFVWGEAMSLYSLGVIAFVQGELDKATGYLEEGLALCRIVGDPRITTLCLNAASAIPYMRGQFDEAERLLRESMSLHKAGSDRFSLGTTVYHLGVLCFGRGDTQEARWFLEEGLALFRQIGDYANIIRSLNSLGKLAYAQSNFWGAQDYYREALQMGLEGQFTSSLLDILIGVAQLLMKQAQRPQMACEIATHVLHNQASSKDAQNRAKLLLTEAGDQFIPEHLDTQLDEIARKTLNLILLPIQTQPVSSPQK